MVLWFSMAAFLSLFVPWYMLMGRSSAEFVSNFYIQIGDNTKQTNSRRVNEDSSEGSISTPSSHNYGTTFAEDAPNDKWEMFSSFYDEQDYENRSGRKEVIDSIYDEYEDVIPQPEDTPKFEGHKGVQRLNNANTDDRDGGRFENAHKYVRRNYYIPSKQKTKLKSKQTAKNVSFQKLMSDNAGTQRDVKLIVALIPHWYEPMLERLDFSKCPVSNCLVTTKIPHYPDAAAVLFNHFLIDGPPPTKYPGQVWIFQSEEPPYYTVTEYDKQWNGMFNYTFTYRNDSVLSDAFGRLEKRKVPIIRDYDEMFESKDGDVAMFESNCDPPSRRQEYVKELMRYIKVDVYGRCGHHKCGKRNFNNRGSCHDMIAKRYKFYLSFENSICKDYISEKIYHVFEAGYPIIPVVRSAPNILDYIPRRLFINTYDFKHPKYLARYLHRLGNDKRRYIQFVKTIDGFTSPGHAGIFQESMCKLCSILNEPMNHPHVINMPMSRWAWLRQCPRVGPAGLFDERLRQKSDYNAHKKYF